MSGRRGVLLIVLVALAAVGCTEQGGADVSERTAEEARDELIAFVESTVAEVLADLPTERMYRDDPIQCTDSLGRETRRVVYNYGQRVFLPDGADGRALMDEIAEYWEAKGYEVRRTRPHEEPAVQRFTVLPMGSNGVASLAVDGSHLTVDGGTRCLPSPRARDHLPYDPVVMENLDTPEA